MFNKCCINRCDILCSVEYITYPKSFFIGFGKYFMTVTVKVFISVEFSRNHERYLIVNAPYRVQYGIDFPSSDFSYKYFPSLQARKIYWKVWTRNLTILANQIAYIFRANDIRSYILILSFQIQSFFANVNKIMETSCYFGKYFQTVFHNIVNEYF